MVQTQNFLNANAKPDNGGFFSNLNLSDLLTIGSKTYSDTLKAQADEANANAAIQLEKLKLQKIQADAAAASSNSTGVVSKIKSYALPIAIIGVMVIGGISAYFYFKRKKV